MFSDVKIRNIIICPGFLMRDSGNPEYDPDYAHGF